jgi:hypothetical protein
MERKGIAALPGLAKEKPMKQMRWIENIGALFLIGAGLIFLLDNLGIALGWQPLLWAVLLMGSGALFLLAFAMERGQWWPLIVGFAMLGAGASSLLSQVLHLAGGVAGAAFFASVAVGFAGVYLVRRRDNWWALIPAGVMAILAVVTLLSAAVPGQVVVAGFFIGLGLIFGGLYFAEIDGQRHNWWALIPAGALLSLAAVIILSVHASGGVAGSALFLGLGLTFGALYLIRGPDRPLGWAWIPSVALLGFGLFVLAVSGEVAFGSLILPLALIAAGLVLMVRGVRRQG